MKRDLEARAITHTYHYGALQAAVRRSVDEYIPIGNFPVRASLGAARWQDVSQVWEWGGEMTEKSPGRSREILLAAAAILYELPRLVPDRLPGAADDLRAVIASSRRLGDGEDREDAIDHILEILVSVPETRDRLNELLPALREQRGEQPDSGGAFLAGDPLPMPYDRYACTVCSWVWPVLDIGDPEQPPATCANGHSQLEFRAAGE